MRPLLLPAVLLFAMLARSAEAMAQSGAEVAADVAVARALSEEAQRLAREGYLWRAIPKFEESIRHEPTPAAMLGLADCHRRMGATATAWGWFHRAEERARSLGDTVRAAEAAAQASALEPRIPRVKVVVSESARAPEITLDGRPLPKSAWSTAIPVDPGEHEIVATTPGSVHFRTKLTAGKEGETVVIAVPELAPAPKVTSDRGAAPISSGAPPPARSPVSGAKVLLIVGGTALGLAGVSGLTAYVVLTETHQDGPARTAGWGLAVAAVPLALIGAAMVYTGNRRWNSMITPVRFRAGPVVARDGGGFAIQGLF